MAIAKGWHGINEVNQVTYDPDKVNLQQIEQRLRESGTYIRTVSESTQEGGQGAVRE